MRQSILIWTAALALAPAAAFSHDHSKGHDAGQHHEHEGKAAGEMATVEGNVLDLACFLAHGAEGGEHSKCAKDCVVRGAPAGIMDSAGNLYLLVEDHGNKKPYDQVKRLAGEKAKVTGRVVKKGGVQALIVSASQKGK